MSVRPIRSEQDHEDALREIDRLFAAEPGTPDADRLEVLAILVSAYEAKREQAAADPMADPMADPIDVLTLAMKFQGRTQADLAALLGSRSRASEVLKRQRRLSGEMVERLSREWRIPAATLSAPYPVTVAPRMVAARAAGALAAVLAAVLVAATAVTSAGLWAAGRDLPDHRQLATYQPPGVSRTDEAGRIVEHRVFVPLEQIPPLVVKAFLAAEDRDFHGHDGIRLGSMARAAVNNLLHAGEPQALQGASTITQQVAKNLLLSGEERSLGRKLREVLLAGRLEEALSKDRILELYLNQIYFGGGAYGVAVAASRYFGKTLDQLGAAEAAYLAALPKAPNHYRLDIAGNLDRAQVRRDWVLARMAEGGFITASAAHLAQAEPLVR